MLYMIYFLGLPVSKSLYRKTRYIFCHVLVCRVREIQYSLNEKMFVSHNKRKTELFNYHFYSVINTGSEFYFNHREIKTVVRLLGFFLHNTTKYRINTYFFL